MLLFYEYWVIIHVRINVCSQLGVRIHILRFLRRS